jgi:hypothetical protein
VKVCQRRNLFKKCLEKGGFTVFNSIQNKLIIIEHGGFDGETITIYYLCAGKVEDNIIDF